MIKRSRLLLIGACIIFALSVAYMLGAILSHNAADPLCACVLCINKRMPAEGEYIYNHYLVVLSIIWITFMIIMGYVVKERTENVTRKKHKKRNK